MTFSDSFSLLTEHKVNSYHLQIYMAQVDELSRTKVLHNLHNALHEVWEWSIWLLKDVSFTN